MTVSRYRLTKAGWLGAFLFVAPTPIAAIYAAPPSKTEGRLVYEEALRSVGGTAEAFAPSLLIMTLLIMATLIGAILLLVGREITDD